MSGRQASKSLLVLDRFVPPPLRPYPYLFWLVAFALVGTTSYVIASRSSAPVPYFSFCILYATGLLTVPLGFRACYLIITKWGETAKTFVRYDENIEHSSKEFSAWLQDEFSFFSGSATMHIVALALAAIAVPTFFPGNYPPNTKTFTGGFALSVQILSSYLAGLALYAIFCGCRLIWRVGSFRIRVRSHKFGVLSTGRAMVECLFIIATAWSLYCLTVVLGLMDFGSLGIYDIIVAAQIPLAVLVLPSFIAMFAPFVICQTPLHWRMIEFKRDELLNIEDELDKLKPLHAEDLTHEVREKIAYYEKERSEIASLPEWPFGFKALLGAVGSSVTIILPTIVSSLSECHYASCNSNGALTAAQRPH